MLLLPGAVSRETLYLRHSFCMVVVWTVKYIAHLFCSHMTVSGFYMGCSTFIDPFTQHKKIVTPLHSSQNPQLQDTPGSGTYCFRVYPCFQTDCAKFTHTILRSADWLKITISSTQDLCGHGHGPGFGALTCLKRAYSSTLAFSVILWHLQNNISQGIVIIGIIVI